VSQTLRLWVRAFTAPRNDDGRKIPFATNLIA
jgi:hypothetical protein